jgi:protein TonB
LGAGSAASVPGADPGGLRRLAFALGASLLVHAWLMWGVPVRPPRTPAGEGGAGLKARIVVAQKADREAVPEPLARPGRIPAPDPRPEPAPVAEPPPPEPPAAAEPAPLTPPAEPPAALELPVPGQPDFFPVRMLDVLPRPVEEVPLVYPESAGGDQSGTVTLLLLIDELGMVVEASVLEADPPGVFDLAAVEAFRGTLFVPGQRDGRPVRSRLVVQVSFQANAESMRLR